MKLVQVESKDREKAQHARNQRALTDTVLEARIRMQKPLTLAARLPRGAALDAFCKGTARGGSSDAALAPLVQDCKHEAKELVEQVLAMRAALWSHNSTLPTPGAWKTRAHAAVHDAARGGKRKREEEMEKLWERIAAADAQIETFRDATIDKWNAKVMLGSGAKAGNKFKALNQSILTQTTNVLQDMDRLVRRTRVKRCTYTVIGSALTPDLVTTQEGEKGEEEGEEGEEGAEAGVAGRRSLKEETDDHAFDDTDFYQLLLRDLIEASSSTQASDLQQQLRAARRQAGKAGRVVDTKASKGRKLRFDIQPKLVNFMFPIPDSVPSFAASLFDNLFKTR